MFIQALMCMSSVKNHFMKLLKRSEINLLTDIEIQYRKTQHNINANIFRKFYSSLKM